jgi:cobalt-zinc-cadmium efflux system protein
MHDHDTDDAHAHAARDSQVNARAHRESPADHVHHDHHHHHHGQGAAVPLLATALALTLSYSLVEVVMGVWTSSLSLLADAGHMFSDAGALGLSWAVARISQRPRSDKMTYGYRRAEVLGAFINAATMLGISLFIAVEAFRRLHAPPALHGEGLLWTASLGLVLNLVTAWLLSRGNSHDLNVRSALLHVLGDALGSLAAILAGVCVTQFDFPLADPLASLAIALVLGIGSLRLLREAADILMEATPSEVDVTELERTIVDTPGVAAVHDLHVWCLTPRQPMLTAHVVLTPAAHGTDVAKRVGQRLSALHRIDHVTIQPEPPAPELVALRRKKA